MASCAHVGDVSARAIELKYNDASSELSMIMKYS